MKSFILKITILLCLLSNVVTAQNYSYVDEKVKTYPKSFTTVDKLAERISKDFTREDEKARAIFTWIASNIRYDLAILGTVQRQVGFSYRTEEERLAKKQKIKNDLANKTLRSRKGVCQGYSTLFAVVAEKVGLEAVIIAGASKSHPSHIGKYPDYNDHAWNAVKINGDWKLLDATWGAGAVEGNTRKFQFLFNDSYFFAKPKDFFNNHYPEDEKWLLLNATKQDFTVLPLYYGGYYSNNYQLITPKNGILDNNQKYISFKIRNIKPTDKVAYVFTSSRMFTPLESTFTNNIAEFKISLVNKISDILTIYVNGESVISYKIK
ncbi:MAG: hypothetical protein BM557_09195 [Flavobacterium sp. MedPE-SWcel]|uniref:transglutaminase domain-containing protein n=1 Tax=uncultured Flavobacterium sp. TaxID=165435 RepID=UPI00091D0C66|nr:transglutaminase domain-containing protein [uncultured Flavobacterium sp.]OIQ16914.1 MAG: hypothetical protein BM557_09195 [Flavobacterium sp. MedPE-SWcel]